MSHHPRLALVLLTGVALVLSACATGPDLDLTIHESERGAVYGVCGTDFRSIVPSRASHFVIGRYDVLGP